MNLLKLYTLFALVCFYKTQAQTNSYPYLKTFMMVSEGSRFSSITHKLTSTLQISFDDLSGEQPTYYYKITHCNIDWTPSNIAETHYLDGFNHVMIQNFENSFGTLQNYTHYTFTLPNPQTQITRSGNYKLTILNNQEQVVEERKIILFTNKVSAQIKISTSRDLIDFNQKQAVSLNIDLQNLNVNFPDQEIKTFIYQNNDLNLRTPLLKPTFYNRKTLTYRPTKEMEFYGGNEFLWFDNHEILVNSATVLQSYRLDQEFHTILTPSKARSNKNYTYNPDINGLFVIRNETDQNLFTESEYSWVQFNLKNEFKDDDEIYIYGAFNNFDFTPENKLSLSKDKKFLTTKIYLKQGFYNYDFVNLKEKLDKHSVSGSFFETENNYKAIVYLKPLNHMFYEVVGFTSANSRKEIEH